MKLVIFGLSVSSSWGNGHATLWRGLLRALAGRGHEVVFFERDVPYYASHRDLQALPDGDLILYRAWDDVLPLARRRLQQADVGIVTSFCPDGIAATELVLSSPVLSAFYDLDTPVTLARLDAGAPVPWLGADGLRGFDQVLSYTGGRALEALRTRLGARRVAPIYGSVDPAVHRPVPPEPEYAADLSYLGTFAADRQEGVEALFVEPARRRPGARFILGGSQYPAEFPWTDNIYFLRHVPPAAHPAFYCSSVATLNVTRQAMAAMGFCPSGRLFEAAACGVPVISDGWEGLDEFFEPGREILVARGPDDVLAALDRPREELALIGRAARERVMADHTAEQRAAQFEAALTGGTAVAGGRDASLAVEA